MSQVTLRENETQESLVKRFTTAVQKSGLLREAKKKRFLFPKARPNEISNDALQVAAAAPVHSVPPILVY